MQPRHAVGLDIVGLGARGPIGLNALQLAMGVRGDLFEPRASPFRDRRGRAIGSCRVASLCDELTGYPRLLALAAPALAEACAGHEAPAPLFVALPEAGRPGDDPRLDSEIVAELAAEARVPVDLAASRAIRRGHAGIGWALDAAGEALEAGAPAAIVGGVDSYHHPDTLAALDRDHRLQHLFASDGFVPGEAAGFVVLRRGATRPWARVGGWRTDSEDTLLGEDQPNVGRAITAVVRDLGARGAGWVLSDVNGERSRRREWSMVATREDLLGAEELRLPSRLGDVGAASGAVAVVVAATWIRVGAAPARRSLVVLSSDTTERCALTVEAAS